MIPIINVRRLLIPASVIGFFAVVMVFFGLTALSVILLICIGSIAIISTSHSTLVFWRYRRKSKEILSGNLQMTAQPIGVLNGLVTPIETPGAEVYFLLYCGQTTSPSFYLTVTDGKRIEGRIYNPLIPNRVKLEFEAVIRESLSR